MGKKIVAVVKNKSGIITDYRFGGNSTSTPKKVAIKMAKNGEVDGVNVSKSSTGSQYIRSNRDKNMNDNLDNL